MAAHARVELPVLDSDDLWPRTPEFRFRLYAVAGSERTVLAAAPDMAGIGVAIGTLHEDQKEIGRRLDDIGRIGIYDCRPDQPGLGEWIVLPWSRSES